jgi:hypothetical protein
VRSAACLVISAATLATGSADGKQRIVVTPRTPAAGTVATISVRARLVRPGVVHLTSPRKESVRVRLRRAGPALWRARYTFRVPGLWRLKLRRLSTSVRVGPYPESTFNPPGAAGCAPPSPANAITREARGSDRLWALFEGGTMEDPHAAVLGHVVGRDTKVVWRVGGTGPVSFIAIAPDGTQHGPIELVPHDGSNWARPGDEWGSKFAFGQTGCWRIHVVRLDLRSDLWLIVRS